MIQIFNIFQSPGDWNDDNRKQISTVTNVHNQSLYQCFKILHTVTMK